MSRSAQCILNETRRINGASEQFIEDLNIILEKYHNNSYVSLVLHTFVSGFNNSFHSTFVSVDLGTFMFNSFILLQIHIFAQLPKDENMKIDVSAIVERSKALPEYKLIDNIKILQSIFSRELPPERFNGLINLIYSTRPSAATKEIENALVKQTQNSEFSFAASKIKFSIFLELFSWP